MINLECKVTCEDTVVGDWSLLRCMYVVICGLSEKTFRTRVNLDIYAVKLRMKKLINQAFDVQLFN
jgi:hypothetical protein